MPASAAQQVRDFQLRATPGVDLLRREPAIDIDEMCAVFTQDPDGDAPRLVRGNWDREDDASIEERRLVQDEVGHLINQGERSRLAKPGEGARLRAGRVD